MVANFKTYEAQARLLAAVIAAHPDLKLNYKAIAKHYGNSQTAVAIEHRFRPLRAAGEALRVMVGKGLDAELLGNITTTKNILEIAQHFGESTADGIQFQFRSVKANAETLKNAVKNQESPVDAFSKVIGGGKAAMGPSVTPGGRRRQNQRASANSPATPTSRTVGNSNGGATGSRGRSGRKRTVTTYKDEATSEDDDSSPTNYSELDLSPTKQTKKVKTTPNRIPVPANFGTPAPQFKPITIPDGAPELSILTPTESVDDDIMVIKEETAANHNPRAVATFTAPVAAPIQRQPTEFSQPRQASYFPTTHAAQVQYGGAFADASHFQSQAPQHHQLQRTHGVTTQGSFGGNNGFWPANDGNQVRAAREDLAHTLGGPVAAWEADDDSQSFLNSDEFDEFETHPNHHGDI